jgi:hypothetical protein
MENIGAFLFKIDGPSVYPVVFNPTISRCFSDKIEIRVHGSQLVAYLEVMMLGCPLCLETITFLHFPIRPISKHESTAKRSSFHASNEFFTNITTYTIRY